MTRLVLANLGAHDLRLKTEYPLPSRAAEILEHREDWPSLELPILVPLLDAVSSYRIPDSQAPEPPLLLLFVTRQDGAPDGMRDKDTDALGRLIQALLGAEGPEPLRAKAKRVYLSAPIADAPQNPDAMFQWHREHLSREIEQIANEQQIKPDQFGYHVSVTGGTPAMNMALMFRAYGLPGRVERVWHVNEATGKAESVRAGMVLTGQPIWQGRLSMPPILKLTCLP